MPIVKFLENTNIEEIPPDTFIRFGEWLKQRKRESVKSGGARSNETINQIICAIKKMYRDVNSLRALTILALNLPIEALTNLMQKKIVTV